MTSGSKSNKNYLFTEDERRITRSMNKKKETIEASDEFIEKKFKRSRTVMTKDYVLSKRAQDLPESIEDLEFDKKQFKKNERKPKKLKEVNKTVAMEPKSDNVQNDVAGLSDMFSENQGRVTRSKNSNKKGVGDIIVEKKNKRTRSVMKRDSISIQQERNPLESINDHELGVKTQQKNERKPKNLKETNQKTVKNQKKNEQTKNISNCIPCNERAIPKKTSDQNGELPVEDVERSTPKTDAKMEIRTLRPRQGQERTELNLEPSVQMANKKKQAYQAKNLNESNAEVLSKPDINTKADEVESIYQSDEVTRRVLRSRVRKSVQPISGQPKLLPSDLKNPKKISRVTKSARETPQAIGASSSGVNVDAQIQFEQDSLKGNASKDTANPKAAKSIRPSKKNALKSKNFNNREESEFIKNEIVLVTISGYAPWPALIIDISDDTYHIQFFGTGQINPVRIGAISRFELERAVPYMERKGYKKAMVEVEMVLGIPSHVSIFK